MSQSYSFFEKRIARILSSSPLLKRYIKYFYSLLQFFINRKKHKLESICPVSTISFQDNETFFGYYDKSPDNGSGLVLVCLSEVSTKLLPREVDYIYLNLYCMNTNSFILDKKIKVRAFNWQQGCRAHWIDSDHFIFNDFCYIKRKYIAKIFSVQAGEVVKIVNLPVQDSYESSFFLSLSYEILAELRPDYGYFCHDFSEEYKDNEIGISIHNIKSGISSLLITIEQICNIGKVPISNDVKHKFNHIMISPTGHRFIFMHRYILSTGQRVDRLFMSDIDGSNIRLLSDYGMVSHCYWFDDLHILSYMRGPSGEDKYWKVNVDKATFEEFDQGVFALYGDGHPSVNGDFVVTDTYPDKARMQSLLLTRKNSGKSIKLGEFYHDFEHRDETRCDLHPRFSSCGTKIFFDTIYSGKRQLCYISLNDVVLNN